jgi:hypothetical protein
MEWNSGMTTPTKRGFVTTYTHYILQLFWNHRPASGKDVLKLIQEEGERSMGSKLALKWAIYLPNYIKC